MPPRRPSSSSPSSSSQPSAGYVPEEFRQASRGIRLQKFLAEAGVASRRAAEELIRAGHITVNGKPVTGLPAWVDPLHDRIAVRGQIIRWPQPARSARKGKISSDTHHVYIMLNKPRRVISTTRDPDRRPSVVDLVMQSLAPSVRLYPVGRLDADSTGLILLTNDGQLAYRLTHPRFGVPKTYRVLVRGRLLPQHIEQLQKGMYLSARSRSQAAGARKVHMDRVRLLWHQHDREHGDRTLLEVTLHQGHNRVIRRMLARLGMKVRRLERIALGPLQLKGLARGQWRYLTPSEIQALRQAAGLLPQESSDSVSPS